MSCPVSYGRPGRARGLVRDRGHRAPCRAVAALGSRQPAVPHSSSWSAARSTAGRSGGRRPGPSAASSGRPRGQRRSFTSVPARAGLPDISLEACGKRREKKRMHATRPPRVGGARTGLGRVLCPTTAASCPVPARFHHERHAWPHVPYVWDRERPQPRAGDRRAGWGVACRAPAPPPRVPATPHHVGRFFRSAWAAIAPCLKSFPLVTATKIGTDVLPH